MSLIQGVMLIDLGPKSLPNWYASTKQATAAVSLAGVALAVLHVTCAQ